MDERLAVVLGSRDCAWRLRFAAWVKAAMLARDRSTSAMSIIHPDSPASRLPRELAADPAFSDWSVLLVYRGSRACGLADAQRSDRDVLSIPVPPPELYFGLREFSSREVSHGEWDAVAHEARKALRLLANGNPNLLEALYGDADLRLAIRPAGRLIIEQRERFLSRHAADAFAGYARSQLKLFARRRSYKAAAHAIRLLRMAGELLRDARVIVRRPDADELLAIRHGQRPAAAIRAEADRLLAALPMLRDRSALPERVDPDAVHGLAVAVVQAHHNQMR